MRLFRRVLLAAAIVVALAAGGVYWLVGSDGGTRWLLRQASAVLPEGLTLGDSQGALLRGVRIRSIEWVSDPLEILAEDVYVDLKLSPLISRIVAIDELDVARIDIRTFAGEDATATSEPVSIDLPVDLSIAAASLRNITVQTNALKRSIDELRLVGGLRGSDLDVALLSLRSPWLTLDLEGSVQLSGDYAARLEADWRWAASEDLTLAGRLALDGDLRRYDLDHALQAPLAVATTGTVSYDAGSLVVDLSNAWENVEWAVGQHRLQSAGGTLRLQGGASRFDVGLDARARWDELPETSVELLGVVDAERLQVSELTAVNEWGRLEASGGVGWVPEPEFDVDYALSDLDPAMLSEAVTGKVTVAGRAVGRFGPSTPEVEITVDRMDGEVNGHPLEGGGRFSYANDAVAISDGRLRIGANRVTAEGSVGETLALYAAVDLAAISEFIPAASGSLVGNVALEGPVALPDARVDLTGSMLTWSDYSIETFSADANISSSNDSSVRIDMERIGLTDRVIESARLTGAGRIDEHALTASVSAFDIDLELEAAGGYLQGEWRGELDSFVIASSAIGRWSNRDASELLASAENVSLSTTCLLGPVDPTRACVMLDYRPGGAATFDLSVSGMPLSALPVELPSEVSISGTIAAHLRGAVVDERLTGDASVEVSGATIDVDYEGETLTVSFAEAAAQATIADNALESSLRLGITGDAGSANLTLDIDDIADSRSAIGGRADASISDVSLLAVFAPGIVDPRGSIVGALAVAGNLSEPELNGEVALMDGAFIVRQAGIEITDLDVRLTQLSPGRLQLVGGARSGEGRVTIRGDTSMSADTGIRSEIVVSGDNFELLRLPDWTATVSPAITIVFDDRMALVTGELEIPNADITIKQIPESAESASPDAIVHRTEGTQSTARRRISVDVNTILGADVRLSAFGLSTGLAGQVRIRGGTDAPYVGSGRVALTDGRYKAYGQELEIERGELIFNGPLSNPQLDVRAIRRATDVVAGIQLSGTPSQLRSSVFSEPALSDAEALSYLLTGRPLSRATSGEGDTLNNAAFALGLSGAGPITSQIRGQLGLETLAVEGGADSGRIVAGKRFGDRLLVEYGYGLIDKLGTLLLRYQLTDRIVLESRTGTVSNLDVVYSVKKQ